MSTQTWITASYTYWMSPTNIPAPSHTVSQHNNRTNHTTSDYRQSQIVLPRINISTYCSWTSYAPYVRHECTTINHPDQKCKEIQGPFSTTLSTNRELICTSDEMVEWQNDPIHNYWRIKCTNDDRMTKCTNDGMTKCTHYQNLMMIWPYD